MEWYETIFHGALGGLTFGIWTYFLTLRQIEEFNKKMNYKKIDLKHM